MINVGDLAKDKITGPAKYEPAMRSIPKRR